MMLMMMMIDLKDGSTRSEDAKWIELAQNRI